MTTVRAIRMFKNLRTAKDRQEAMIAAGYSSSYARTAQIKHTKGYQFMIKPIAEELEDERDRIIEEIKTKDLTQERYKDLVDSIDKLTKNIQLLHGEPTEITNDLKGISTEELRRLRKQAEEGGDNKGVSEEVST